MAPRRFPLLALTAASLCERPRDCQDAETCARVERGRCTQAVPQGARGNAGHKRNDAAKQVEETERSAAQLRRRGVSDHRGQQPLRHPHYAGPTVRHPPAHNSTAVSRPSSCRHPRKQVHPFLPSSAS